MNQTINISLPKSMLDELKDLVEAGHFASVSEAIRAGINHVKTTLHPKYVTFGPRAMKRFEQAEKDYRAGKTIAFKSAKDMDNYLKNIIKLDRAKPNHTKSKLHQENDQVVTQKSSHQITRNQEDSTINIRPRPPIAP